MKLFFNDHARRCIFIYFLTAASAQVLHFEVKKTCNKAHFQDKIHFNEKS